MPACLHPISPTARLAAGQARDDDVEESNDAVDDGHDDGTDSVHDCHEDIADSAEDGFDLCFFVSLASK